MERNIFDNLVKGLDLNVLLSGKLFLLDKIRADTSNEVSALLVTFAFEIINHVTMGKDSHFTGQQYFFLKEFHYTHTPINSTSTDYNMK